MGSAGQRTAGLLDHGWRARQNWPGLRWLPAPPMMPDYAIRLWQCKLRYRTQEELLEVAREYSVTNLPISVIVIDFFHWPNQGDWSVRCARLVAILIP